MSVKFHIKALALYAIAQTAEGNSAIKKSIVLTGTVTTLTSATSVTGVGTSFLSELAINDNVFDGSGAFIGKIASITSDTVATLAANALVAVSAAAITSSKTSGTITTTTGAATVTGVGTAFLTELAVGVYIYNLAGLPVGRVLSVATDTSATLETNATVGVTAAKFSTGLGAKNAIAVLNFNYSQELDSEAFQYLGDELNRDEETSIKDRYCKLDFETFVPSLGTLAGTDPLITEVPMVDWMTSSGFATVLSSGSQGFVKFTNSLPSNTFLTIEVRRSSPDLAIAGTQKVYTLSDCRGNIDLDATVGTRAKFKFNYQGNLDSILQKPSLFADFGDQKAEHVPNMNSRTITVSELEVYNGAIEPTITDIKNFCFDKLNAPNLSGFNYTRYLTSCIDGWSKGAVPTDVTLAILEDAADAVYNPDNHLEENHNLAIKYGSVVGKKAEFIFHKLQLAKISSGTIGEYVSQELGFRNVGYTDIILK